MAIGSHCNTCINSICLFISLPFLFSGYIWKLTADSPCDPIVYKPLLAIGLSLFLLSLFGLIGSCCGCSCFLFIYLMVLLAMIISIIITTKVGVKIIKDKSSGEEIIGIVDREHHLSDFSSWVTDKLIDDSHWLEFKDCMVRHDACGKIQSFRSVADFIVSNKKLTPIEHGCCKPPAHCGFQYDGNSTWKAPEKGITSPDPDCKTWSNQQEVLCYNCGSCKAGYLAIMKRSWLAITVINDVILILLIIMFICGCCALCN